MISLVDRAGRGRNQGGEVQSRNAVPMTIRWRPNQAGKKDGSRDVEFVRGRRRRLARRIACPGRRAGGIGCGDQDLFMPFQNVMSSIGRRTVNRPGVAALPTAMSMIGKRWSGIRNS